MTQTYGSFQKLINAITYDPTDGGPRYVLCLYQVGTEYLMRWECPLGKDLVTGADLHWKGRYWRLSEHMVDGEVVQTAFGALMWALEHEARETFKFYDRAVLSPHYDIWALFQLAGSSSAHEERPENQQRMERKETEV